MLGVPCTLSHSLKSLYGPQPALIFGLNVLYSPAPALELTCTYSSTRALPLYGTGMPTIYQTGIVQGVVSTMALTASQ